jgi:hypothetical protein
MVCNITQLFVKFITSRIFTERSQFLFVDNELVFIDQITLLLVSKDLARRFGFCIAQSTLLVTFNTQVILMARDQVSGDCCMP